jgi:orotidine-5'-phosphate decarboxylase
VSDRPVGEHIADLLATRVAQRESQIVLGLDPDPLALWAGSATGEEGPPARRTATAVLAHCRSLIDAAAPACVAVKLQLACFERLGAFGWETTAGVIEHARERGLLVIADGKRGDISVSARAYAQSLIGATDTPWGAMEGLGADLLTVNPLMGAETIEPFLSVARDRGAGLFVLVRTSNPGAADIEDLDLAQGGRVWERLATMADQLGQSGIGKSGLSDVGAVIGATVPGLLARARELMPHTIFLLPGVGAQGGQIEELAPAFLPGRTGGLVTVSRGISSAHELHGGKPSEAARGEAHRLRDLAWALS